MTKPAHLFKLPSSWRQLRPVLILLVAAAAASLGLYLLQASRADTAAEQIEAESGTPAGNIGPVDDVTASGGRAMRFGAGEGQPAATSRQIPVSPAGYLGQFNLSSSKYIMGFRFILDKDTPIDRWYFAINGEGASCVGGRTGYGSGTGGTHFGRIVEVDQATGLPTNQVVASENINACTAHNRSRLEFNLNTTHQIHFIQFLRVTLAAGKMYAFLLSNTDSNPGSGGSGIGGSFGGNHMSPNLNFAKLPEMGPNGKNTLDPKEAGAVYGLDPRETTLWSMDAGASWLFGDKVGWYGIGNGEGRMWTVGYRVAGGANTAHGWPALNWPTHARSSLTYHNVPKDTTLTQAGGASMSGSVGIVTVKNDATGVTATTPSLGVGMVTGQLSRPVPVAAGQSYTVSNSGVVDSGSGGAGQGTVFGVGSRYPWEVTVNSGSSDLPMLFALPHPFY